MIWSIAQFNTKGARGWVVTNDPTESAQVLFYVAPDRWQTIVCNEMRADVLASGAHATGLCGFSIDAATMSAAMRAQGSALLEERSRVLLHRHVPGHAFHNGRVFHLAFQESDRTALIATISKQYRLAYLKVEQMDQHTASSLLALTHQNSLLMSGVLAGEEIARALDAPAFLRITQLPKPEELVAMRLDRLCALARNPAQGPTFLASSPLARMITALDALDPGDEPALTAWEQALSDEERQLIGDPITRQLCGTPPEQPVTAKELSDALTLLSQFDAVGVGEDPRGFAQLLSELLELDIDDDAEGLVVLSPRVQKLAASPIMKTLCSTDRKLYDLIKLGRQEKEPSVDQIAAVLNRQ